MKILQLGKFYPIRGGVEKVMYDLTLGLSEAGIDCDMLCASTEDHPSEILTLNARAHVFIMPTSINLAATKIAPAMVKKLRKIAKDYDVIHVHHPDPMACLALFLSGYRGKVVLHWHSDILKQKTLLKAYKPLQNWLIKRADKIVGTTPTYVKESPFLAKVQHKVDYLPIGVEPLEPNPEIVFRIRQEYPHKKVIFSLGRLVNYKGYEYLVKAAQYLPNDYVILIGGKGPLKEELDALIDNRGLREKVQLLGYISDEEAPSYFQAADLFCLSSILKTEAFAIVQIEAMSCGKPIVTADIPGSGVGWVNEDGVSGLLAPIENERVLAEKITQILGNDQLYEQLSQGARTRFETLFTRKQMAKACLAIYHLVLQN
ncbi:glycosyltransferase [Sphingobacterium sp. LRF_L2]|uniref:glycosyltransferase n=1 Tax=Sphingobacterium sp. LRF_L2 TaxID=3369421 RepID=UPI003F5E6975